MLQNTRINDTLDDDSASEHQNEQLMCHWATGPNMEACGRIFTNGVSLFNHVNDEHIGRRQTHNLSLVCNWLKVDAPDGKEVMVHQCGYTGDKRDHIVSHVRIHIPSYRPHQCKECLRCFSRAQDLKKHVKIHERMPEMPQLEVASPSQYISAGLRSAPIPTNNWHFSNLSDPNLTEAGTQFLNGTHSVSMMRSNPDLRLQNQTHAMDNHQRTLKRTHSKTGGIDMHIPTTSGIDTVLSDFLGSIKTKRVRPEYNPEMAAALNAIASHFPDNDLMLPQHAPRVDLTRVISLSNASPLGNNSNNSNNSNNVSNEQSVNSSPTVLDTMDIDQVNLFLSELYQNVESSSMFNTDDLFVSTMAVNVNDGHASRLARQPSAMSTVTDEDLMKYLDYEAGQASFRESKLTEDDEHSPVEPLSAGRDDDQQPQEQQVTTATAKDRDPRIEVLRRGMEELSVKHAFATTSPSQSPSQSLNRRGPLSPTRPASMTELSSTPIVKQPAAATLSDPSSMLRMISAANACRNKSPSKLSNSTTSASSLNEQQQQHQADDDDKNEQLVEEEQRRHLRRTSHDETKTTPTAKLHDRRHIYHPKSTSHTDNNMIRLARSQSQPVRMDNRSRDRHLRVLQVIMRQLAEIWEEANKAQ